MTRINPRATIAAAALAGAVMGAQPVAAEGNLLYRVTITNLTAGQVVTPPLAVTHRKRFVLFETATMASDGLAVLAEEGNPAGLEGEVSGAPGVADVVIGEVDDPGVILPGGSSSLEISTTPRARYLSFAAMLAVTNDAFAAVRGLELPLAKGRPVTARAVAYDAGSEGNNQLATHVPALGGAMRDEAGSEGFIHIHRGVHDFGDLDPAVHDWRNPVVELTAERIR